MLKEKFKEQVIMSSVADFHVATFYSEGPPHDKGLALRQPYELLRSAFKGWCRRFHGYSLRRVRKLVLHDGTAGAVYTKEFSSVAGYLRYPNTGYNAIGFGAFKPFIVLHLLEQVLRPGQLLLFMDCNVLKHWNLAAYPQLAAETTRWFLDVHGNEGVAQPRENPATRHVHICSKIALDAAEGACGHKDLASLPSPHSNRIAIRAGTQAAHLMRLWLNATQREDEYLPSSTRPGGRWHTPEQCSFGLIDGCRHGPSFLWFEYFFTPLHARWFGSGAAPAHRSSTALLPMREETLHVARARTPPHAIAIDHRWGKALTTVSAALARSGTGSAVVHSSLNAKQTALQRRVDACLVFPRHAMRCPGVIYQANSSHWNFAGLERPFVARPL